VRICEYFSIEGRTGAQSRARSARKSEQKKQKPADAGFCFMGRSCIEKVWQIPATGLVNGVSFVSVISL
jgi:tryptophan synthase alpha subunit